MRLRIVFSKTGSLRYTGHLDLQTVWERTIRRAGLPLAYTHGFHPGPKIQIASALPLGFLGRLEIVDIWLTDVGADLPVYAPGGVPAAEGTPDAPGGLPAAQSTPDAPGGLPAAQSTPDAPNGLPVAEGTPDAPGGVPAAESTVANTPARPYVEILQPAAPPGLTILSVEQVEEGAPALQTQVVSAEYEVTLLEPASIPDLDKRLQDLLAAGSLPRQRRGRDYDLRPLIEEISLAPTAHSEGERPEVRLFMRLAARQGATGRPEEVLDVLGIPFETARIERTRLILKSEIELIG